MNEQVNFISGKIVDVLQGRIYGGSLQISNGKISDIIASDDVPEQYILPGFVDAHVHIESSMLTPTEFGRMAVVHGTVATVSDPHEIANVLGLRGVRFMLDNAQTGALKICFGAPSCVPATSFETAGAIITCADIETLFAEYPQVGYLSEVMNFPGVLNRDPEVMDKIALAKRYQKPIDGHAPALRGIDAQRYIAAGIHTDHECFTLDEALEKLQYGMKIIIREGSAAKNFEALAPLIDQHWQQVMFCSDDKHPNDLLLGHINDIVKRALAKGYDLMKVLTCACINPVLHYQLPVGLLQTGHPADFIVLDNLTEMNILQTCINGVIVAQNGKTCLEYQAVESINQFCTSLKHPANFALKATHTHAQVIEAIEGQLVTNALCLPIDTDSEGFAQCNTDRRDILKIAVVNRYADAPISIGFINNFGLKEGAIASSVAHDSHNIIAVGTNDEMLCRAVNALIAVGGGLSCTHKSDTQTLALPLAGIMSTENAYKVAHAYTALDKMAKKMGCKLYAPYMTLSFMALLVIPNLKVSDKGLFDGKKFAFTPLFVPQNTQI